mgnify:CR=1 FL=1
MLFSSTREERDEKNDRRWNLRDFEIERFGFQLMLLTPRSAMQDPATVALDGYIEVFIFLSV